MEQVLLEDTEINRHELINNNHVSCTNQEAEDGRWKERERKDFETALQLTAKTGDKVQVNIDGSEVWHHSYVQKVSDDDVDVFIESLGRSVTVRHCNVRAYPPDYQHFGKATAYKSLSGYYQPSSLETDLTLMNRKSNGSFSPNTFPKPMSPGKRTPRYTNKERKYKPRFPHNNHGQFSSNQAQFDLPPPPYYFNEQLLKCVSNALDKSRVDNLSVNNVTSAVSDMDLKQDNHHQESPYQYDAGMSMPQHVTCNDVGASGSNDMGVELLTTLSRCLMQLRIHPQIMHAQMVYQGEVVAQPRNGREMSQVMSQLYQNVGQALCAMLNYPPRVSNAGVNNLPVMAMPSQQSTTNWAPPQQIMAQPTSGNDQQYPPLSTQQQYYQHYQQQQAVLNRSLSYPQYFGNGQQPQQQQMYPITVHTQQPAPPGCVGTEQAGESRERLDSGEAHQPQDTSSPKIEDKRRERNNDRNANPHGSDSGIETGTECSPRGSESEDVRGEGECGSRGTDNIERAATSEISQDVPLIQQPTTAYPYPYYQQYPLNYYHQQALAAYYQQYGTPTPQVGLQHMIPNEDLACTSSHPISASNNAT